MSKSRRELIIDGNWDSGWLAGHESMAGWTLGMLRDLRAFTPEQGRKLIDTIGTSIQAHRKRLQRQDDWGDALCTTVETCAKWLTPEQIERIRAAIG
jgi:hypothetical protein